MKLCVERESAAKFFLFSQVLTSPVFPSLSSSFLGLRWREGEGKCVGDEPSSPLEDKNLCFF